MGIQFLDKKYPHLFREVVWPWGPARARFECLEREPPDHLIANVNIVPRVGRAWALLLLKDGAWEIPGGTLEPGETFPNALVRELREEAGARLRSFCIFGAWRCHSLASEPYRPHLPFPDFYRIVGTGEIELDGTPENLRGAEQVARVECVPLETAIERFTSLGRHDLAELYHLASQINLALFHIGGARENTTVHRNGRKSRGRAVA
jgi:8-oxo-dGTP pyrophosphatase MutT (NUDIX family)